VLHFWCRLIALNGFGRAEGIAFLEVTCDIREL
jgi:hypothetical protein